nr:ATP-binding protein [Kofleriaceae bacterium]
MLELPILLMVCVFLFWEISDESHALDNDLKHDLEATARITTRLLSRLDPAAARDLLQHPADAPTPDDYDVRFIDPAAAAGSVSAAVVPDGVAQLAADEERIVDGGGRRFLYRGFELGGAHGAIEVSRSTADMDHAIDVHAAGTAVVAALVLALGFIYAITIGSRMIARPTAKLVAQFRRVGAGELAPLGGPHRDDELGALAAELDVMITRLSDARSRNEMEHGARLAAVEQLRHADRLTTVGTLAAGMAHELGTPLNVISGYAKLIATGQEIGAGAADSARIIGEQTERVVVLVRQLLDFSRRGELRRGVADVRPAVTRALEVASIAASKAHVKLRYSQPAEPLRAEIDEAKIQQVVVNLAVNAIQASAREANVELAVSREVVDGVAHVRIDVTDHGAGMPPERVARVFEPFFTTKPVGEGTGLGLAVSHGIVEEHHGTIEVTSELGAGTTFSVFLPEASDA